MCEVKRTGLKLYANKNIAFLILLLLGVDRQR